MRAFNLNLGTHRLDSSWVWSLLPIWLQVLVWVFKLQKRKHFKLQTNRQRIRLLLLYKYYKWCLIKKIFIIKCQLLNFVNQEPEPKFKWLEIKMKIMLSSVCCAWMPSSCHAPFIYLFIYSDLESLFYYLHNPNVVSWSL